MMENKIYLILYFARQQFQMKKERKNIVRKFKSKQKKRNVFNKYNDHYSQLEPAKKKQRYSSGWIEQRKMSFLKLVLKI